MALRLTAGDNAWMKAISNSQCEATRKAAQVGERYASLELAGDDLDRLYAPFVKDISTVLSLVHQPQMDRVGWA